MPILPEKSSSSGCEQTRPALLLAVYLMLVMGCFIMGRSLVDSVILTEFKGSLPRLIAATALTIAIFMSVYIRLSRRLPLGKLIAGTLLFFSFSFALFGLLAHFKHLWVYFPTYLWVYAAGVMGPSIGWTLANYVLTTRQAKRWFGLIGAGPILGSACAGFLTAAVGKSVEAENLLLFLASLMAIAVIPTRAVLRGVPAHAAALLQLEMATDESPKNLLQTVRLLLRTRYLLLITLLIAVSCLCTTIVDYQFRVVAGNSFSGNQEGLLAFFGHFYGWMGLGSLLLQLLLTPRLLKSFGIRWTLFILPLMLMAGSLALVLVPTLLSVIFLRGSHHLLRYSVDKSSLELLYLPVAPSLKGKLKPFMDSFVWRVTDGISGLVLVVFAEVLHFSPDRMSWINFITLGGWIGVVVAVRGEYLNVLRQALEQRALDPERTLGLTLDHTTTDVLAGFLDSNESQQVLYGLSFFELGQETAWHPYLRVLLEHPSAAVRHRALSLLCDGGDTGITATAERLVEDESAEVRGEALRYLVLRTGRDPLDLLMHGHLEVPDYVIQSTLVAYLGRSGRKELVAGAEMILEQMLANPGDDRVHARAAAARVLGVVPHTPSLNSQLVSLLQDDNPIVAEQALLSAAHIRDRELLPAIIGNLGRPRLTFTARTTLIQYGDQVQGTLQDYLNDDTIPIAVRMQIPGVLARIANEKSTAILCESLIQGNPGLRYEILKALNWLKRQSPALVPPDPLVEDLLYAEIMGYYRSHQILEQLDSPGHTASPALPKDEPLLLHALRERMEYELERIFLMLALLYTQRDIENAYSGLRSRRPRLQANALEVLEHLLKPELARILMPAIDDTVTPEKRRICAEQLCRSRVESRMEAFRILLRSEDRWLQLCTLHDIGEAGLRALWDDIRELAHEGDPILSETWEWAAMRIAFGAEP